MTLEERIIQDMKNAMRSKDKVALRGIRAVKAAIMLLKTDGSGDEITPEKEIKLVQKMVKQRKDSYDIYVKQGREDLAAVEQEEIDVISQYLPKQLDEESLKAVIAEAISEVGAVGMKDMGKVMGVVTAKVAGQAEGKVISGLVKEALMS